MADIRKALDRGQPLGHERFREEVEAALGRRLVPGRRGRRSKDISVDPADQLLLGL